ncbi:MAG: hypothetical protein K2W81_06160 [Sphingomonas sp.]|uniref:hypothetical protein n=1 Tax=Sphingomonas sp. TaxID=28214 RepID=UPI0025F72E7B|nr:hypothetical protein [Sphingomonas sp.]MBY0283530.1 hypothetical protein [Sphingomonas sp.]
MIMPSRADGSLLPALLALVLALLAVFQLLTGTEALPPESYGRVIVPIVRPRADSAIATDPAIVRAAIFTPVHGTGRDDQPPASLGPLGDAAPVGITRARGITRVILQRSDGQIIRLPIGRRYQSWRLTAVTNDAVRFSGPDGSVRIPLADRPISPGQYNPPQPDKR